MNKAANIADKALGHTEIPVTMTPSWSPTETMRAIVYAGKKQMECKVVPKPMITHPEDVIVKVTATTVCSGSDSHVFAGEIPGVEEGFIVGHESVGVVDQVGSEVSKFKVGDRVAICFNVACGTCSYCKRKEFSGCDRTSDSKLMQKMYGHNFGIFGYGSMLGSVPGCQAEFVRVPYADVNLYPIPDSVSDEKALYMTDIISTAFHALEQCSFKEGESVAIWGMGPIGLCTARWAQILGASKIIGVEPVLERAQLAREKLGITVIDPNAVESVPNAIFEMIPDGTDCCVEAAGFRFSTSMKHKIERKVGLETDTSDLINECFTAVRKYGKVSMIADYAGYTNHFFIGAIQLKHLNVQGGQTPCQRVYPHVMPYLESGEFDPSFLVTNEVAFEEIPAAYDKLFYKQDGWVKILCRLGQTTQDKSDGLKETNETDELEPNQIDD